jgi:hypothetical protein
LQGFIWLLQVLMRRANLPDMTTITNDPITQKGGAPMTPRNQWLLRLAVSLIGLLLLLNTGMRRGWLK